MLTSNNILPVLIIIFGLIVSTIALIAGIKKNNKKNENILKRKEFIIFVSVGFLIVFLYELIVSYRYVFKQILFSESPVENNTSNVIAEISLGRILFAALLLLAFAVLMIIWNVILIRNSKKNKKFDSGILFLTAISIFLLIMFFFNLKITVNTLKETYIPYSKGEYKTEEGMLDHYNIHSETGSPKLEFTVNGKEFILTDDSPNVSFYDVVYDSMPLLSLNDMVSIDYVEIEPDKSAVNKEVDKKVVKIELINVKNNK